MSTSELHLHKQQWQVERYKHEGATATWNASPIFYNLQTSNMRSLRLPIFSCFVQDLLKANGRREVSANQRSQSLTPVTMLIAKTCQNQFHNFMPRPSVACALVMRVMDQKTNPPCNRTVRKVRKHQEVSSSLAARAVCQRQ